MRYISAVQILSMKRILYVLVISVTLGGCTGCEESPGSKKIEGDEVSDYEDNQITEEQRERLLAELGLFVDAPQNGDFEYVLNNTHPNFMTNPAERRVSLERMQEFWDSGARNYLHDWELTYVSPRHDLDSLWVCFVKYDVHAQLDLLDEFEGIPTNYLMPLKEQFAFAEVTYDSLNTIYDIKGPQHIYAFFEKENDDVYFISTGIVQTGKISSMVDLETLKILRSYEY